jgi:hypothetical protein
VGESEIQNLIRDVIIAAAKAGLSQAELDALIAVVKVDSKAWQGLDAMQ